jgi:hypothetical protein
MAKDTGSGKLNAPSAARRARLCQAIIKQIAGYGKEGVQIDYLIATLSLNWGYTRRVISEIIETLNAADIITMESREGKTYIRAKK